MSRHAYVLLDNAMLNNQYVPSLPALKKRIKAFHAACKKSVTPAPSLAWCRDFTAALLGWESWNALHLAHEVKERPQPHCETLFASSPTGTMIETLALIKLTEAGLKENLPGDTSKDTIETLAETLWHLQKLPLLNKQGTLPSKVKMKDVPVEYWREQTFVFAPYPRYYNVFKQEAGIPALGKNGGIIVVEDSEACSVAEQLALYTSEIKVIDLTYYGALFRLSDDVKRKIKNMKYTPWLENEKPDWDTISSLIECELLDIEHGRHDFPAQKMAYAITLYFRDKYDQAAEDNKPTMNELLDTGCPNGDEIQLAADSDRFTKDEKHYLEILSLAVNHADRRFYTLRYTIDSAVRSVMSLFNPGHNPETIVTTGDIIETTTPFMIIVNGSGRTTDLDNQAKRILYLLCLQLNDNFRAVLHGEISRKTAPARLAILPYNMRFAPKLIGVAAHASYVSNWAFMAGGHPDTSWNDSPSKTCVVTFMANACNIIEMKPSRGVSSLFSKHHTTWCSTRHFHFNSEKHPLQLTDTAESREKHFFMLKLT